MFQIFARLDHHSQTDAVEESVSEGGDRHVKPSARTALEEYHSKKSTQYWEKGTGYGHGATNSVWNHKAWVSWQQTSAEDTLGLLGALQEAIVW